MFSLIFKYITIYFIFTIYSILKQIAIIYIFLKIHISPVKCLTIYIFDY